MRIFVAGAGGLIGVRLVPLLVTAGHLVAGMTRSPEKSDMLRELGAQPVIADVYDAGALTVAVTRFAPDLVVHQLTDLPDAAADLGRFSERSNRMRTEGTRNLVAAAAAAGARRIIAQSVSWEQRTEAGRAVNAAHERAILQAGGVVIRYGQFWGPGTYHEAAPPDPPRIHIDEAARQTVPALDAPPGLTIVVDDRATVIAR